MHNLVEILKIVDGALNADHPKVVAYTEHLAKKLDAIGDKKAAQRLRRTLTQTKIKQLHLARLTPEKHIPADSESRLALADEEYLQPEDIVVFLEDDIKDSVNEFINFVRSSDKLLSHGVDITPSLLTYGPPGCGKTELGKYIAAQLNLPLLLARTDSLISSYLGSTAKNLRLLFEHAMSRPCVLFLDEFDAIAKLRDDRHELGELKRVVVSLLQNIDALDQKTILLAATNHEHLLDSAVWRRFAYKIHMKLPSSKVRLELFSLYLKNFSNKDDKMLFSVISEGLTGSDIRDITENAIRNSILLKRRKVDAIGVIKKILNIRLPSIYDDTEAIQTRIIKLRNLNPKIFTYRRLGELFDISIGKVSGLLGKQGVKK